MMSQPTVSVRELPFKELLFSVEGHVATVTLNRPEKRNALTPTLVNELIVALEGADADPEIGEAFHMSSGGDAHPGLVKHNQELRAAQAQGDRLDEDPMGTWNFHWAGVVMKSAGDTMTLENYSVSKYHVENKKWAFQLYGVGKKGQSFHDEHKDKHMQHGDAPTTMTAQRPKP